MSAMDRINPIAAAVYFALVAAVPMFSMDPILVATSLLSAAGLSLTLPRGGRSISFAATVVCVSALVNLLVSHNGSTVLFFFGDDRITLEAFLYGLAMGSAMGAVMLWFMSFSRIMTSDKLLYILGRLSPKLSLILSMGLRYTALLSVKAREIKQAGEGMGLSGDRSLMDRARGGLRVFSALVTWALENGITTADSMSARGYGTGKRTHFSVFSFTRFDVVFLCASASFFALCVCGMIVGGSRAEYYPVVRVGFDGWLSLMTYISYGALALTPVIIETEEALRWKYLRSRI